MYMLSTLDLYYAFTTLYVEITFKIGILLFSVRCKKYKIKIL